jgi:hypothetical protein
VTCSVILLIIIILAFISYFPFKANNSVLAVEIVKLYVEADLDNGAVVFGEICSHNHIITGKK